MWLRLAPNAAFTQHRFDRASWVLGMRAQTFHANRIMEIANRFKAASTICKLARSTQVPRIPEQTFHARYGKSDILTKFSLRLFGWTWEATKHHQQCMHTHMLNCNRYIYIYIYIYICIHEGRPKSKDRLRIALEQVNTPRRFKVARPQSSVGFVPSKFSTDCII
jgi:hypothetical protein